MILLVSTVLVSEKVEGDNYPARPTKGFTRMVHGQLHMIKISLCTSCQKNWSFLTFSWLCSQVFLELKLKSLSLIPH